MHNIYLHTFAELGEREAAALQVYSGLLEKEKTPASVIEYNNLMQLLEKKIKCFLSLK